MNPSWDESEFVFYDLQGAARSIRGHNPGAACTFLEAAYDTFEFLVSNPSVGRKRSDLEFPEVRSWRVTGYRTHLILYGDLQPELENQTQL